MGYLGKIGVPPGGGVRLDEAPPGSLANRLGLQPGDVVKRVNGQAVATGRSGFHQDVPKEDVLIERAEVA